MRNILKRYGKLAVVALIIGSAALFAVKGPGAVALDIDQSRTMQARTNRDLQVNYYRITVNFNDPRVGTAQKFGRLLQNTFITSIGCHVITAFNAATTNVVTIGTSLANSNEIVDASTANMSINEASANYQAMTAANALGVTATSGADVDLYVKYTQTGAAATAGKVTCVINFVPDNDM